MLLPHVEWHYFVHVLPLLSEFPVRLSTGLLLQLAEFWWQPICVPASRVIQTGHWSVCVSSLCTILLSITSPLLQNNPRRGSLLFSHSPWWSWCCCQLKWCVLWRHLLLEFGFSPWYYPIVSTSGLVVHLARPQLTSQFLVSILYKVFIYIFLFHRSASVPTWTENIWSKLIHFYSTAQP